MKQKKIKFSMSIFEEIYLQKVQFLDKFAFNLYLLFPEGI